MSIETKKKMSSRSKLSSDTLDGCKRIYRGISEAARQLEEKQLKTISCSQLFSPEMVASRVKIADLGISLALREPKVFGKKCEDVVWRKVFYSAYVQAKQLLKSAVGNRLADTSSPLTRHLMAGIGFYHSFVFEIQVEFQFKESELDLSIIPRQSYLSTMQTKPKIHDVGAIEWAQNALLRSLIYLGDLHRYLSIHSPTTLSDVQSARFYTMASHLDPKSSMPFNQLGTLASAKGKKMDAALYYLRCLTSDTPFDGAEANLRQVLNHPQNEAVLRNFLSLVHAWWFSENSMDVNIISEDCIMDFKHIISSRGGSSLRNTIPVHSSNNKIDTSFFNSDFLVKLVSICMISYDHLRRQNSIHAPSVVLFTLSFLNLLTEKLVEGSAPLIEKKLPKKKALRRRRKNRFDEESDESDDENVEISCSSESSSSESEQEESDDVSSEGSSSDTNKPGNNPLLNSQDLTALGCIKLCCDWLRLNPEVLKLFSTNFRVFLGDFVKLLNIVVFDCKLMIRVMRVKDSFENVLEAAEQCPLPEDAILRNHKVVDQSNINWNFFNSSPYKSDILLRLCKVVNFALFMTSCSEPVLKYDSQLSKFVLLEQDSPQNEQSKIAGVTMADKPKKQNKDQQRKLMQNMGQLWLQEEVKNLETRVSQSHDSCVLSPYLVLDSSAILFHLHLVKQLVISKKFVVIVPISVLESLDELKKESAKAREAIRWLENQFHKGNRFLRAQRANEALAIPLIKCPKKKERDTWTFFQILECCNFLAQQQVKKENQDANSNLISLVVGTLDNSQKDFSPTGLAASIGINVETIAEFSLKLKSSNKKKHVK